MNATHLTEALKMAEDDGVQIAFWWRDDDAVAATPALDRLMALSACFHAPLALAVIPAALEPSLAPSLRAYGDISVLVHGLTHHNYAAPGEKRAEFGAHRPVATLARQAEQALALMQDALTDHLVPVFVPPWNRVSADLIPLLASFGFAGLSTFGNRSGPEAAPGLAAINTHIDPIDWHGSRSLVNPDVLGASLARAIMRRVRGETTEPIGLLTHHLTHDEAVWTFCECLLERLAAAPAVRFRAITACMERGAGA